MRLGRLERRPQVAAGDVADQAVVGAVGLGDRGGDVGHLHHGHDRGEGLLVDQPHPRPGPGHQRRRQAPGPDLLAALHRRAGGAGVLEQHAVAGQAALGGHRAELEAGHARAHALEQVAGQGRRHQHPVDRVAGLAGVDEALGDGHLGGHVEVGVGQHHQRAVAAELERERLQARRGPAGDQLGHPARAGEGDLGHARVGGQGLAQQRPVAGQARDQPRGQAGPLGQVAERPGRQGRLLGRLDDHRAAGRQRRRQLPDHQRHGEVPGHDRRHHPDRRRPDPAAAGQGRPGHLLGPEPLGLGGEVVHDLGGAGHLGAGLGQRLADLAVDQGRQPLLLGVDQGGVGRQRPAALDRRQGGPGGPGRVGGRQGAVDVLGPGGGDLGQQRAVAGGAHLHPLRRLQAPAAGDQRPPRGGRAQRGEPPLTRATWRMRQAGS